MQNAVYDNTVQLFVISASYLFGIAAHGIQTDEQVTADYVVFAIVERDDVGIIIVLQVFPVYFKNLFVIAKDVGSLSEASLRLLSDNLSYYSGFKFMQRRNRQ